MLDVIDVSRWQGTIDWKKVKASGKVGGMSIRALKRTMPGPNLWVCQLAYMLTPLR